MPRLVEAPTTVVKNKDVTIDEYFGGAYSAPWRPRGYASLCNALFRARDRRYYSQPSAPVLLSDELHINTNFNYRSRNQ